MKQQKNLNALVLAGSRRGETDAVAREAGVSCKAFAPVAGRSMVERVLQVLLDNEEIDQVTIALEGGLDLARDAPRLAEWLASGRVSRLDAGASPSRTAARAIAGLPDGHRLLITTADHPLLDAATVDQFLSRCHDGDRENLQNGGIDAFVGFLPLNVLEAKYPDMKRTGLRFREGRYSGCNLFMLRAGDRAQSLVSFWRRLESLRKSPLWMARVLGPASLVLYGLRRLTLRQALTRLGDKAGGRIAPVILDIPEAAIDVDRPGDLAFVEKLLS